jgi:nitrogen fixation-related uncharacterized protein
MDLICIGISFGFIILLIYFVTVQNGQIGDLQDKIEDVQNDIESINAKDKQDTLTEIKELVNQLKEKLDDD